MADPAIFERMMKRNRGFIMDQIPLKGPKFKDRIDDIYNSVLALAWKKWEDYSPAKGSITTWLGWLVRLVMRDESRWYRQKCEWTTIVPMSLDFLIDGDDWMDDQVVDLACADPCDVAIDRDVMRQASRIIDQLGGKQPRTWRRILAGLSQAEIARIDGVSDTAVWHRIEKSKHKLQTMIEEEGLLQ